MKWPLRRVTPERLLPQWHEGHSPVILLPYGGVSLSPAFFPPFHSVLYPFTSASQAANQQPVHVAAVTIPCHAPPPPPAAGQGGASPRTFCPETSAQPANKRPVILPQWNWMMIHDHRVRLAPLLTPEAEIS